MKLNKGGISLPFCQDTGLMLLTQEDIYDQDKVFVLFALVALFDTTV